MGTSLVGQQRHHDAEPLLLSSYESLKQNESSLPPPTRQHLREIAVMLADLYKATGESEKAGTWQQRANDYDER